MNRARAAALALGLLAALALPAASLARPAAPTAPAPKPRPAHALAEAPLAAPAQSPSQAPVPALPESPAPLPIPARAAPPALATASPLAPPAPASRPAAKPPAPNVGAIAASAAASAAAPRLAPAPRLRPAHWATAARLSTASLPRVARPPAPSASAPVRPAALRADDAPCGDSRLRGALLSPIRGVGGCGLDRPIRLDKVAGVRLDRPTTLGCDAAMALADWVETVARPAARARAGADLAEITTFAGYACRPRNSRPGAKLSEHGRGNAIDIGAITLSDGREITVLEGWRNRHAGLMRDLWRGACGPFGTVLGPESDRFHVNHLHFDVARYRSGPVCR